MAPGSIPRHRTSRCFAGPVGVTLPVEQLPAGDLVFDAARFSSWGAWAFCRFNSEKFPAVRMGFQKGGFNIGARPRDVDPGLLQLHLEIMSREGAILWVPTGTIPAERVECDPRIRRIILRDSDRLRVDISGWPRMTWHLGSDDGRAAVRLEGTITTVTILPDCMLPHSVFSMWESTASVRGTVAWQGESTAVEGYMFFDHPRVLSVSNDVTPRKTYLYTTMCLGDGSCLYGYHSADSRGSPIEYYCFGVYVDREGKGRFLPNARTDNLGFDKDGLPSSWRVQWADNAVQVDASISVQETGILAGWGAPVAPRNRRQFSIIPLVLDGLVRITTRDHEPRTLPGRGLGEYFDAQLWDT